MEFEQALSEAITEIGLEHLKPKQKEAIKAFVEGKEMFVILPSGYGKSVIYGILPIVFDKMRGRIYLQLMFSHP